MKRTRTLLAVLTVLASDPSAEHWGYDIGKRSRVASGALYPILRRLVDEGWIVSSWESDPPGGKPPRRYYTLTETGILGLGAMLSGVTDDGGRRTSRVRWA